MSFTDFQNRRLGKYSDDDSITSLTEFNVQKHSVRHTVSSTSFAYSGELIFDLITGPCTQDICTVRELHH